MSLFFKESEHFNIFNNDLSEKIVGSIFSEKLTYKAGK